MIPPIFWISSRINKTFQLTVDRRQAIKESVDDRDDLEVGGGGPSDGVVTSGILIRSLRHVRPHYIHYNLIIPPLTSPVEQYKI